MCGIFGWISSESINSAFSTKFYQLLKHRGPDAQGHIEIALNSVIGMTRLSINDLGISGNQPLVDPITRCSMVFNGEVYNFKKVREQLLNLGHNFYSGSDTEVILRSYLQWGVEFIEHLEGMFAIAIWDLRSKKLLLVRDRFGQKPLYYLRTDTLFAFCSEAKAIIQAFPTLSKLNLNYKSNYLAHGYVNNSSEMFENIRELLPGNIMIISKNEVEVTEYWNYRKKIEVKSTDSLKVAKNIVDNLLDETIKEQLEASDVPVGVLLSSGIDSSLVAKKALQFKPNTKLFTLGFKNSKFDESRKVSDIFKAYRNQLFVRFIDYDMNLINTAIKSLDMPIADSSAIPMYLITKFASQHVKTCLTGDGADEIFAGYSTHQATQLNSKIMHLKLANKIALKFLDYLPKKRGNVNLSFKVTSFLQWSNSNPRIAHQNWRRIFTDFEIYKLTGTKPEMSEDQLCVEIPEPLGLNMVEQCLVNDVYTWLLNDILVKIDRVSMSNSLELRAPFLSKSLVEYVVSLPTNLKYSNFRNKIILRSLYNDQIGPIGNFSVKRGFGSPVADWIFYHPGDFYDQIIESNLYDKSEVDRLFEEHKSRKRDNGQKIYALFVFSVKSYQLLGSKQC